MLIDMHAKNVGECTNEKENKMGKKRREIVNAKLNNRAIGKCKYSVGRGDVMMYFDFGRKKSKSRNKREEAKERVFLLL